jgi:hypothetical protein
MKTVMPSRLPGSSKLLQELKQQTTLGKRLLAGGMVLMIIGVYFFVQARRDYASASRASGQIVEIEREQHRKDVVPYPVFSFTDSAGTTYVIHTRTSQTRTWSGWNKFYKVGDAVEVLYPPGDPERARLNNLFSVWGTPLGLGGIGLILAIVGIVLWYSAVTYPVNKLTSRAAQLDEPG